MQRNRGQPANISELLDCIFQRLDPKDRRGAYRIWSFWEEEVGETIARHAEPAGYHRGVLSVRVSSHTWMQELQFTKGAIRERLNARLGGELIRDIYFVSGPTTSTEKAAEPGEEPREAPCSDEQPPAVELPPIRDPALAKVFDRIVRARARRS